MNSLVLEADTILGKFRLLELLGEGGMGMVWLAQDTKTGRKVALKVMQPHLTKNRKNVDRFLREGRTAANVEHARIVRIYEVDEDRGIPFIAMELLAGQELANYLHTHPQQPLSFALQVVTQVAEGLAAAHGKGLIHRDIKPSNVWLCPIKSGFECKILDFGLARAVEGDSISTKSGGMMGTPAYMPPEQWRGERDVDHRADLYALGVFFYQLTTGRLPFEAENTHSLMYHVLENAPVPPVEQNRMLPLPVNDLILELLEKDKRKRIPDAATLIGRLEEIQQTLTGFTSTRDLLPQTPVVPLSSRETDSRQRTLESPTRKRWLPLILSGLFALLLGMGITYLIVANQQPVPNVVGNPEADAKREAELKTLIEQQRKTEEALKVAQAKNAQKPGKTAEEIAEEKKRQEDETKRLALEAENRKLQEKLKELANLPPKVEPKIPIKVVPKKPEPLDCTGEKGAEAATVKRLQQEWADCLGVKTEIAIDLGGGVTMEFVLIPPGKFMMGGNEYEIEKPVHEVTLTQPFYLGKYEVTHEEYTQLTGLANPSSFKNETTSPRHPVERVSWDEAKAASDKLSGKTLPKGFTKASLPTEAQWEHACRAGTKTHYSFGDSLNGTEANSDGKQPFGTTTEGPSLQKTTPVGKYKSNALGLFDMHGNVYEWCLDGWDEKAYRANGRTDPFVDYSNNSLRVLRGGSWDFSSRDCRSAIRNSFAPEIRFNFIGFRLLMLP